MEINKLHENLRNRIISANLKENELKPVQKYLYDEHSYFKLLAACFTPFPNQGNKRFIDILKSKNPACIEYEYLGYLLYQAAIKKCRLKNLPAKEISEEQIHLICLQLLKALNLNDSIYTNLASYLKNENQLRPYIDWMFSAQYHTYIPYTEFF